MKYKNINVPFIGNPEIKRKADSFRMRVWGEKIPVEIETIIEIKLKIKIIPIPNLFKLCSVDSQISSDFSSILVDQYSYLYDETNRLNFSLAHEIGHYVLHKNLYKNIGIKDLEGVFAFIKEIPEKQYFYLEAQANKFASNLLVPREGLLRIRKGIIEKYKLQKIDGKTVNSYIANSVAKYFAVSSSAAEIALNDLNNFNNNRI